MSKDRKRRWLTVAAAAALVLVFAATWLVLDRTEHRPRWVVIEAPKTAAVGQKFEVRVRLERSIEATMISCSLHRANAERRGWGYLASSGPSLPAVGGGTYSFTFDVPEREDTAFAFIIVYLSPTGEWREGTRAVSTELVPVSRGEAGAHIRTLEKIGIHSYRTAATSASMKAGGGRAQRPRTGRRTSAWVHSILAALLIIAALSAMGAGRKCAVGDPRARGERAVWFLFAGALAVSAAVEISGIAGHIASLGRQLAREQNVYELRRPFQKAVMAAVAAASLGLFFLFIKAAQRPGPHRALWWAAIGVADYLAVSFAGVLSFHAVDVVRDMAWHGLSPFDALRGAGILTAIGAAALSVRRGDKKAST
jgi:hypothetical protein